MKKARAALWETPEGGERLRLALDAFSMGVWDWNLETNDLIWDERMYELFGFSSERAVAYSDFVSSVVLEDLPHVEQQLTESVTEGRLINFSFRIRHSLKGIRHIQAAGKVIRNNDGKAVRMTGLNWDITEQEVARKEGERERREQDEKLKVLFSMIESSRDYLGYLDSKGNLLFLNRSFKEIGWSDRQYQLSDIMDSDSCRRVLTEAIPQVGLGHTWAGELRFSNKNQQDVFPVIARLFPIVRESRDSWLVGLAAEDVRDRIRTEQSMMESSRLAGLGQMATQIAHEINNPLAIISGKAQLIRQRMEESDIDRAKISDYCDSIDKTIYRVTRIIRGLKSLARQDQNAGTQQVPVKAMVDEVLELCSERFRNAGIHLVADIEGDLEVCVRPIQIQQVILNLLNNSFDALQNQGVAWVEVSAKSSGATIQITVTDSGLGIPEPILKRLMEPFFTTKEVGKGTGLGLSTSKAIIESHGGSFYYDRDSAHTRFTISLPVTEDKLELLKERPHERS